MSKPLTPTDETIAFLVAMVTLLLGENPKNDRIREELFEKAVASGHIPELSK